MTQKQNLLIDNISNDYDKATDNLKEQGSTIKEVKEKKSSFRWMYIIITVEVVLLMVLLYLGLT